MSRKSPGPCRRPCKRRPVTRLEIVSEECDEAWRIQVHSQRQLRVGEVIRHALVQLLDRGEANDPGLDGVSVTVTEVRISPNLRNATAFVMPLGGANSEAILGSLNRASSFFRHRIAGEIDLRRLPTLSFEIDDSFDNAGRIDALLRNPVVAADVRAAGSLVAEDDNGEDGDDTEPEHSGT